MPVFKSDDPVFQGYFAGQDVLPELWTDRMPYLGLAKTLDADVASMRSPDGFNLVDAQNAFEQTVKSGVPDIFISPLANYMNTLGALNFVTSMRSVVAQVAVSVGYWSDAINTLEGVYRDDLNSLVSAIDLIEQIVNSEYFQQALDGIAWVPIVGWILKVIGEVVKLGIKINQNVMEERAVSMQTRLARRYRVPLIEPSAEYTEYQVRGMLRAVRNSRATELFLPRYPAKSVADWEMVGAPKDYTEKCDGKDFPLNLVWYMRSKGGYSRYRQGFGLVPGTGELVQLLEFPVAQQQAKGVIIPEVEGIRSTGRFVPTARAIAGHTWQNALKENALMFAIDSDYIKARWDETLHAMLQFLIEDIIKGYTMFKSGRPHDQKADCGCWMNGYRQGEKYGCRPKRYGKPANLKSWAEYHWWGVGPTHLAMANTHAQSMWNYIMRTFWGRGAQQNEFPLPVHDADQSKFAQWPDNFFFENTVYAAACDNMKARQKAVLLSPAAFYVHPYKNVRKEGSEDITPFPALAYSAEMTELWKQSVKDMLNETSTQWLINNVALQDVPIESTEVYNALKAKGVKDKKPKFIGGTVSAGPYGATKPPPPPEQSGLGRVEVMDVAGKLQNPNPPKGGSSKWTNNQKVLAATAAALSAGYVAYRVKSGRKVFSFPKKK